jgi:histidyl-tRNA synthetase
VAINSVGDAADRPRYRRALLDFLQPKEDVLCADCRRRLTTNPLRVLDCKVATCRDIVAGAPSILDHLGDASRAHFARMQHYLDVFAVPYRVDPNIVRGLDYYTGPVFELLSTSGELGTQSTLVGGGRYDGLIERLGGPATPAVGFALGVERAILSMPGAAADYAPGPVVFFATRGDAARERGLVLAHALRRAGVHVDIDHRGAGMKAQFKRADKLRARYVIALGDDELASGQAVLRDMSTRDETPVKLADLEQTLAKLGS